MPKYRSKPTLVEAVQWNKPGDHPAVEARLVEILFDRQGHYFYVTHCDPAVGMPTAWLAVDEKSEVAQKNGLVLPFAIYEVKSGNRAPVAKHEELLARYMRSMNWSEAPKDRGLLKATATAKSVIVEPGDFIVTDEAGVSVAYKPAAFAATFEPDLPPAPAPATSPATPPPPATAPTMPPGRDNKPAPEPGRTNA